MNPMDGDRGTRTVHKQVVLTSLMFVLVAIYAAMESLSASAQDGSLLRSGSRGPVPAGAVMAPMTRGTSSGMQSAGPGAMSMAVTNGQVPANSLLESSWIYEPPAPTRVYRLNDIVTIRVDEISRLTAEGNSQTRRNTLYDAILKDWLQFDGIDSIKPAQQADGDPRIQGSSNQLFRADSSVESRQSLTFNIASRIVDIRPNGDLVLEAKKTIIFNDNAWETSLSGTCRATDIAADNVVLSRDLLDLQINTRERGQVRDGYKRGWFTQWLTTFNPF